MPVPTAVAIELTEQQRAQLEKIVRKQTAPQREVTRARIVLLAAQGLSHHEIARRLGCSRYTVWTWRGRFFDEGRAGLADRPRPGRPRSFSPSAAP
ncbi:MAG: helix-turn-helix domain-containing protein [Anaerolineae bacterium]|nr:helix-turn-helix domain-containing protein [Anaerolineae bacterium]